MSLVTPSKYQYGQPVTVTFTTKKPLPTEPQVRAKIKAVHFYPHTKYDLEIKTFEEETTRLYNVDEVFIHELSGLNPETDSYLIAGWKDTPRDQRIEKHNDQL